MRYPTVSATKKWLRYEILFILGMIAGFLLCLFINGKELEYRIAENNKLITEKQSLMDQIELMKKQEKRGIDNSRLIVEAIKVMVESETGDIVKEKIARKVEKELSHLKGQTVQGVGSVHRLLFLLFQNKKYMIDDHVYSVHLHTLVISDTIYLYVSVTLEKL